MSAILSTRPVRGNVIPRWRIGPLALALPALLFLACFFILPVSSVMVLSVQSEDGSLTARHFAQIFATDVYFRVLVTTFKIALGTAVFSLLLGYPVALWLSRMTESLRSRVVLLVLLPFWTSYLVKTFAWMIFLGQHGVLNQLLGLAGVPPVAMLHNQIGLWVGMVHAMLPLAVLTLLPVMTGVDERLSSCARTLGAAPSKAFWLVYFPLTMPGVAAAGLLTFISSLGFFIVPALLGGRTETTLAQLIISQIQEVLNWSFAGALSTLLLLASLVSCWLYGRVFGMSSISGNSAERVGKGGWLRRVGQAILDVTANVASAVTPDRADGRTSRFALRGYALVVLAFLMIPSLLVIPIAFTSSQTLEVPPPGYSLQWFSAYLDSAVWTGATWRSFRVAFFSATVATVLGLLAALALARSTSRWRGLAFNFFLAPMIVPRIVLAVGLFYLFSRLGLVATDTGLVIGHAVLAIPFTLVALGAVLKNHDWRLEQAASTLGASRLRTFALVTLPRIRDGVIAAFLFAFITSFDELTIAMFVSGGVSTTLPKQMWDDMVLQLNPTLAAVSVIVSLIITVLLLIAEGRKGQR